MPEPEPERERNAPPMTPEDALARMAAVTSNTRALRVRTEGLTLFLFAVCMMASYLTIVVPILFGGGPGGGRPPFNGTGGPRPDFDGGRGAPPTQFFLSAYAPLAWYAIAVLGTIGVWRSASLSFQHGMSTPRLVAVLVGWSVLFALTTFVLTFVEGGNPRYWHLVAWALVIGLFAAVNPLRFTTPSRVVAGVISAVTLLTALYAYTASLGGRDIGFLTGLALGVPGIVGGLWLMFRG